jgi:hypothetical protein
MRVASSAATLLFAACAHSPDPRIATDRQALVRQLEEIPPCPAGADPNLSATLNLDQPGEPVRIHATLRRVDGLCTLLACERACCNQCFGRWGIEEGGRSAAFADPAQPKRWEWGAMDCSLDALGSAPTVQVLAVVQPRREASSKVVLESSELCRLGAPVTEAAPK